MYLSCPQKSHIEVRSSLFRLLLEKLIFIFQNNLTGEHTCIMLRALNEDELSENDSRWLHSYWQGNFRYLFSCLFSFASDNSF